MSFKPAAVLLHAASAAIMAYGYKLNDNSFGEMGSRIRAQKGGHFQFLTMQGLVIAWITMMCSLALDLFPSFTSLGKIKRTILMVAMPLS